MWVGFRMRVIAEGGLEAFQRAVMAADRKSEGKMFDGDRIDDVTCEAERLDRMTLGEVLYFALFGEGMQAA